MHPPAAAPAPDPEDWAELTRLAGESGRENEFLLALARRSRADTGAEGAALYVVDDGRTRRVAAAGDVPPPAEGAESNGIERIDLGSGSLVLSRPQKSPLPWLTALLSTALRVNRLRRELKRQGFEVKLRGVELEALYDVGLAITSMLDLDELSEGILLRAVSLLDARRGALYLRRGERLELGSTIGGDAAAEIATSDPVLAAILAGEAPEEQSILPGAEFLEVAPIEADGVRRGLIVVGDKESRTGVGPFAPADKRTLDLFTNQASIALENARLHREALEKQRLEREMELAVEIQRRLLPTIVPEVSGFEILGWSRPARHVGGDYYDLIALRPGSCGLVVGDVSGKGVPAALMVSTVHSALRLLLDRLEVGPELIEKLNRHIAATSAPNKFITFFMAEVDAEAHQVRFMNAGHNPALLMSVAGEAVELDPGGLPLGLLPDSCYEGGAFAMHPGDLLCIYSDGITEATAVDDEEFGVGRLVEVLAATRDEPLESIISAIDRATAEFSIGMPQADDQTLLLLRRSSRAPS